MFESLPNLEACSADASYEPRTLKELGSAYVKWSRDTLAAINRNEEKMKVVGPVAGRTTASGDAGVRFLTILE
jgi:hypothetical protein